MEKYRYLICYHLNEALENEVYEEPSKAIEALGINLKEVTFDYILNQWIFHHCTNIPKVMPLTQN